MNTNPKRNVISIIVMVLVGVLLVALLWSLLSDVGKDQSTYDEFLQKYEQGQVKFVYFDGFYNIKVVYTDGNVVANSNNPDSIDASKHYDESINVPSREVFWMDINAIHQSNPTADFSDIVSFDNPSEGNIWSYILPLLSIVGAAILVIIVIRSIGKQNNQSMDFGKSRAKVIQNIKVRFTDVAGAEEEKEELAVVIDFLKSPKKYTEMGARIPRGILLVGPPGTGKTLFAKAVAGEAGVPFFSISGSDFVEMFVGVGASRVRDLFDAAKKNTPCIIFIDEIDAVGRQRGAGLGGGHDEREQTLNQMLVEMDGFETNSGVIVMAATNRSDILDPALLRPGRFDKQIRVNRPDVRGREGILKVHARNKPFTADVDFKTVARITAGFTGADLENLLNESAILATRAGRKLITPQDINEGINSVIMGPAKKSRLVTERDKRITAYHEAGHAILAASLKYCNPVHEVTVIPRGGAEGYTMTRPDNDNNFDTKAQMMDEITMTLGGRVAEELVIKNISNGAQGDIRAITKRAHQMVTEWGMSDKIGPLYYGSGGEVFVGKSYQTTKAYSEKIAGIIDEEIHVIIDECYVRATKVLTEKIDILHNMARVLFEKETIRSVEVEMLLEGKSVQEVIDYMEGEEKKLDEITKESAKKVDEVDFEQPQTETPKDTTKGKNDIFDDQDK